jgi:uncharacterized iron-regulated protein
MPAALRWALALLLLPACAPSRTTAPAAAEPVRTTSWQSRLDVDAPLVGVIWDVAARRRAAEAELVARVQAADIVLLGETHDNPDHHRLQADLLRAFAGRHDSPAVVFEMLDHAKQPVVDATLRDHPGDVDALGQAVDWASSGWPDWGMYRPVFEAAIAVHARILAAGLERGAAMRIAHDGAAAFDPGLARAFGLDEPLPAPLEAAMRDEMSEAHCGLLPDAMLGSMVLVQRVRDALLAGRLHEGGAGHGAVLVAGAGHVRRDRGVPAQLARVSGGTSVAIGLLEARPGMTKPEDYAEGFKATALPFDYVWFTPRASDVDHCAEMREHMKARPKGPSGDAASRRERQFRLPPGGLAGPSSS